MPDAKRDTASMLADLKRLKASPEPCEIGGETLQLRPFKWKHFDQVVDLVEQAKAHLRIDDGSVAVDVAAILKQQRPIADALLVLLSGKPQDWIDEQSADEVLYLFACCVRVNADFFIQRLAPLLMMSLASLGVSASLFQSSSPAASAKPSAADGQTSSPS